MQLSWGTTTPLANVNNIFRLISFCRVFKAMPEHWQVWSAIVRFSRFWHFCKTDILQWIDLAPGARVSLLCCIPQELPWFCWARETIGKEVKNILHLKIFKQEFCSLVSTIVPRNTVGLKIKPWKSNCHFLPLPTASEQFKEFSKFQGQFKSSHKFKSCKFKLHWKQLVPTQSYETRCYILPL